MPTEVLAPDVPLDSFAPPAMAEIERREGYEGELRVVLRNCKAPIAAAPE